MREIEFTTQFKKDYKRVGKSPTNKDLDFKLQAVVDLLCADLSLPFKLRDHKLKGQLGGVRECHLKPNLLLIYYKDGKNLLVLVRLGTHSDLF
ncbi:MAG: type II toxin-antitoxin system YafQ family toxin [Candidatus Nanopelagicus sp.]